MPNPLSHKYPIPISQLCLVNTDVPAGVGAPPLDTTWYTFHAKIYCLFVTFSALGLDDTVGNFEVSNYETT